jgi:hypothetical protein
MRVMLSFLLLILGLSSSQVALGQGFIGTKVSIAATTTTATTTTDYTGGDATSAIDATQLVYFNGASLGQGVPFDPTTGTLSIIVASDTLSGLTFDSRNRPITYPFTSSTLYYRVYLDGTTAPFFTPIALTLTSASTTSSPVTYATSSSIDLFAVPRTTGGGTYRVDLYLEGQYRKTGSATSTPVNDPGSGAANPSSATFRVNAPASTPTGATTTWQSTTDTGGSTEWASASNWSNGVPTATSNAIIPAKTNSAIVYPILNNPAAFYAVNNLTLQGNTGSSAAQLTIGTATLRVYGNIIQPAAGLKGNTTNNAGVLDATQNSTLILAGADQIITGQLLVSDIIVAGSGLKSVINTVIPSNILAFRPTSVTNGVIIRSAAQDASSGTVQTVFDTTGNSYITLVSSSSISSVPGYNETNTSFIQGVTRADRTLVAGVKNNFGNIGLDVTPNHTPGNIFLYRVVGDPLTGPLATGAVAVKRYYQITGDDDATKPAFASSSLDVVFHYLDSEDERNGIKESNLNLFTAQQNGAPFKRAYGTLMTDDNTVTRTGITSAPNFYLTLGDETNPLPVVLTAFTATRTGTTASLTWQTASEQNNKGFEVQVATDGVTYRTLAFVESHASNSVQARDYQYLDTESGKVGMRYYRLHQIDLDGTDSYSPIRTVSFTGNEVIASTIVASPNPFTDKLALSFNGTTPGDGTALVTLVDMAGRTVSEQRIALNSASMTLSNLDGLRAGLYVARITLPDGSAKTVRIQKQ